MFACNLCTKTFQTQRSLNSHRAWHSGTLKSWKDAAKLRYPVGRARWRKHGKVLVRAFLRPLLHPDTPSKSLESLVESICTRAG
jgi:hypothetical protein